MNTCINRNPHQEYRPDQDSKSVECPARGPTFAVGDNPALAYSAFAGRAFRLLVLFFLRTGHVHWTCAQVWPITTYDPQTS